MIAPAISRRLLLASAASSIALFAGLRTSAVSAPAASTVEETLESVMERHVTEGTIAGAVWAVYRAGERHVGNAGTFEMGAGSPMARDTIFRVASITKPVVAAAAMRLVETGILTLDGPVDELLPELANRRVLKSIESDLDDTVAADRPITLRDLLTMTFGLGAIMVFPEKYPIQAAMREAGVAPGPQLPTMSADEYMKRLGALPLAYQPGERFLYNNGLDVAGVLISRATGKPLGAALSELIFEPLGMVDTGFHVPEEKLHRLPTLYGRDFQSGETVVVDGPRGRFSIRPQFESGAGGLVSTVDDYLAFARMMLNGGELNGVRLLERQTVTEMTRNQLTREQREHSDATWFMFSGHGGWGLGMSVAMTQGEPWVVPGRFGWDGGYGTSAYVDPQNDVIGLFFSQKMMDSPEPPQTYVDFWRSVYRAN